MRRDAVSVLTVYVVLLFAVPSALVFKPVGSSGTPAGLLAGALFLWWLAGRLVPSLGASAGRQPLRIAASACLAAVLASDVVAYLRPIDGLEIHAAQSAIVLIVGGLGVVLLTADGVSHIERLDVLLGRLTTAGAALASLGIVQFFTRFDIAAHIHVPGLSLNESTDYIQLRDGFNRVAGTAAHPIEFGVVLATVFPIAIHQAMYATPERRNRARVRVALIAVALPMSVSRSAMLGVLAAGLVMAAGWTWRRRAQAAVAAVAFVAGMRLVVPGLMGTIRNMFTGLQSDSSYVARTQHASEAYAYIGQRPWFGRGFGTFLPSRYVLLDNQYLGLLVETGVVGLLAFVALFCTAFGVGHHVACVGATEERRSLGWALAAAAAVPLVTYITFDAFGFAMANGVTMLVVGCAGALWRIDGATAAATAP
jgi:O-antigen ligase